MLSIPIFKALHNYLPRPTCGNEVNMLLRAISCGGVWNGFLPGKAKNEDVPCRSCGKRDGDGLLFWECTFLPSSMSGIFLGLLLLCPLIAATGPVVCFGMGGCLDLVVLVAKNPWGLLFW